jgi:hypothetical protein
VANKPPDSRIGLLLNGLQPACFFLLCFFSFCFCLCSRFRALAFCLAGLVILYVCIHLRQNSCVFVAAVSRNAMPFLDGRRGTAGVRKWARNHHPAFGLCRIMHTLAHTVHMGRTTGEMSGREWEAERDGVVSSSEPSATQNAQIRAWEQRTDHPRFQTSLCSNRLFFVPLALHPSLFPTTTTPPHKLTNLTYLAKLSLKWLVPRYVHPPQ